MTLLAINCEVMILVLIVDRYLSLLACITEVRMVNLYSVDSVQMDDRK